VATIYTSRRHSPCGSYRPGGVNLNGASAAPPRNYPKEVSKPVRSDEVAQMVAPIRFGFDSRSYSHTPMAGFRFRTTCVLTACELHLREARGNHRAGRPSHLHEWNHTTNKCTIVFLTSSSPTSISTFSLPISSYPHSGPRGHFRLLPIHSP
jgi:hypothetical protein